MAGPRQADAVPLAAGRILLVEARFYPDIAEQMVAGATRLLEKAGATWERLAVPGAFEIPAAIALAAEHYDGFVALGCIIRGETTHYDYVCGETARKLMDLSADCGLAIGYGVLTVENLAQAEERADPARQDKGGGAAEACLALLAIKQRFLVPA